VRRAAIELVVGLVAFVLAGWGLGELWVRVGNTADVNAIKNVADWRPTAVVDIAKVFTWLGSSVVLIPLGLVVCFFFWRADRRHDAAAIALSLGGAIALWHLVKPLVGRPRPPVEHLASVNGTSFPSGHSTQAAAFWLALALALNTTWGWVGAVAIVVVVCSTRVILGVHYPGDVIAGALLGGGWAVFCRLVVMAV